MRRVFENKEIHAVSIATPKPSALTGDHLGNRVQAGKDVYVEKPCSHNVLGKAGKW
ncbi:MAG: Gfo/Idh/MocA family oxidoreductase [Cyclobacteriaceae bacterium]|nr:Gfo/Idh/MocA family oxidoreductase [Cyclobacteriaceae bacterium]